MDLRRIHIKITAWTSFLFFDMAAYLTRLDSWGNLRRQSRVIYQKVTEDLNYKRMDKGLKVKFISASDDQVNYRGTTDPRGILNTKDTYTLSQVDAGDFFTYVELEGIQGRFNSVHFKVI